MLSAASLGGKYSRWRATTKLCEIQPPRNMNKGNMVCSTFMPCRCRTAGEEPPQCSTRMPVPKHHMDLCSCHACARLPAQGTSLILQPSLSASVKNRMAIIPDPWLPRADLHLLLHFEVHVELQLPVTGGDGEAISTWLLRPIHALQVVSPL